MVSSQQLRSAVESALLGPSPPTPSQRIELMHALRSSLPALQSFLSYPLPKASDRSQVQSKEVRLPDSPPISLDDTDVMIALKLSDDLNLNEIECVRLLVSANKEWGLSGREPLEIFRLAAGLWYMERRDLITSLYTLLRSVVLDQGMEADLVADIQKNLEDLFNSGFRQRLIILIKELNREEPAGYGGPNAERFVLDSRGVSSQRRDVVSRERLSLGHCLVLSVLVLRMSSKDVKDVFATLKDCAAEINDSDAIVQLQITFSLLFALVIAFMSDALSTIPDKDSVLSHDASFRHEFHDLVVATGNNPNVEGFVDATRLAWTVHLVLTEDRSSARGIVSSASSRDLSNIYSCLELICSNNVFQYLLSRVLQSAAYQRGGLKKMFISEEWATSKFAKMDEGNETEKTMTDVSFWRKLEQIHKTVQPLVYVLKLVDGDAPTMGVLYDEMDKAKIAIANAHDNNQAKYQKYWDVIDERWNSTLHSPLHAAGYFLNPAIRYRPDVSTHPEIRRGLQQVIGRIEPDLNDQLDAINQNDDEDMVYIYNGYMHKLMMCFLSHPLTRDKVKEMKEKAMTALSPYMLTGSDDFRDDTLIDPQQLSRLNIQPFVSILELVSEIYKQDPELLHGNEDLWTFVSFAGEDHTNIQTLVAFLKMLGTLASNEEGASKVFELLQSNVFRSIGWTTLFDCLSIYEEKFKQSLQTSGTMLPDFQEGDAHALVAYLNVLQKVVENGNPTERKKWFPDIEPLFKLLSYENVPPFLKGALRNAISAFIRVSPVLKDTIWSFLEQYDLPVLVGSLVGNSGQTISSQVYDMRFELNEVEARRERYPSTISFLNLINALIGEERDVGDRGRRFVGIFRFVYDHVFGPFPQRAYADPNEKWQLVVACLQHFHMVLTMYDIKDDDIDIAVDISQSSTVSHDSPLETQLPILELLKDFMSGKIVFRNIMSIVLLGVNTIINERTSQIYGPLLEKAVHLSLEIIILVLERDLFLADFWRPLYQPLDIILSQDHNQIVALLEYVRYDFLPQIQQSSIKIMRILSSRMVGLVQLLLKSNASKCLIDDFATCLESRFDECQVIENTKDDAGILILQLLIDNITRPSPNITLLLLKFDVDGPVEQTVLQPKFHYSCLKVILDNLEKLSKPDINALLYEFCFQLLYELCMDPLTSGPIMDLLSTKKYQFFSKHLETICVAPLPKRSSNQALRISTLHQRAWLLKLLALELHLADVAVSTHRETCVVIFSQIFTGENRSGPYESQIIETNSSHAGFRTMNKSKVLELLEVVQFRSPDIAINYSPFISKLKCDRQVEDILRNPATSEMGGVYYYSERGDRLIDLDAFQDKLWQMFKNFNPQMASHLNEVEKGELKESIHQLLRWGWRYNKNLEEQAAQLHMLTGWSHIVEVSISRRIPFLEDRSQILLQLLDASLSASASPDCSLKMAIILSNVALTCIAKLRDERFLCPGGIDSDNVTCLDIISVKQLSSGACQSILFKLMMAILRNESSEVLRRRQYALLLSYFQYCRSILDPDIPASVLHFLLHEGQDGDDGLNLQKTDRDQADLARANFSIIRKEAQAIVDVVTKDAIQGSEAGKALSLYVLDALISIDQEKFFLNQLQSRGIPRLCLMDIGNFSPKDGLHSLESLQRLYTLEAQLSLLLRISHNYGKHGAQILLSMGALEHLASCKAVRQHFQGSSRRVNIGRDQGREVDVKQLLVTPILRLVSSLTSLVDSADFLEVKNKIVREVIDFIKVHQSTFDQILREYVSGADELTLERVNLVVSILSKVWPYEEDDEYGFVQELFGMMHFLFPLDVGSSSFSQLSDSIENQKKTELIIFRICFSLSTYIYFLITKKLIRLQVVDGTDEHLGQQQPTLVLLVHLLNSATVALQKAGEEKYLLLNKIQDINELSRQEVDEVISVCKRQDCISSYDNIRKRRSIAMVEMCHMAGNRDLLITLLLQLAERVFNILLIHFQDEKTDSGDLSLLCGKLHPTLERLQQLREDKIGHGLKLFHRSVSALKELSARHLAP